MKSRYFKIGALILLLAGGAGLYLALRHKPPEPEEAYIGERMVTLWSRLSQVREPLATLHFGERVVVLDRKNDQTLVRTVSGLQGWVEQRHLMDAAVWRRAAELRVRAQTLPVQAKAHARVPTNVHLEPGRSSIRIFQFPGGLRLEILERAVAELKPSGEEPGSSNTAAAQDAKKQEAKREDWVLVRGTAEGTGEVAGWVLRRFIDYDVPQAIADYAAGFRFVAWFELNRVSDGEKLRPQYLAAGVQGGDGRPCDFTLLRVYTWGLQRRRYETAYVESNLCGHFPIMVQPASAPGGDPKFSFVAESKQGRGKRMYGMHQTSVHRIDLEKRRRAPARRIK
jgi:hypothetical protein